MTLDDQLLYINKWGVNQAEGCQECQQAGLGARCFVAVKVSQHCGNCLKTKKRCSFVVDEDDDAEEEMDEEDRHVRKVSIVEEEPVVIRRSSVITVYGSTADTDVARLTKYDKSAKVG